MVMASSGAQAFGPPSVVVNDAEVQALSLARGGYALAVTLEGVVGEQVAWEVTATASAGWVVDSPVSKVTLAAAVEDVALGSVGVQVAPVDTACPPAGLVLDLRLVDPTGYHDTVRERLYYRMGAGGLEPIALETYLADAEAIDAGVSQVKGCAVAKASAADALAPTMDAAEAGAAPMAVTTVTRTFTGKVVFWDSRGNRSNAAGSRLRLCTASSYTCAPGSEGCCWRPVPYALVSVRVNGAYWSPEHTADGSGNFTFPLEGQPESASYQLRARTTHKYGVTPTSIKRHIRVYTQLGASSGTVGYWDSAGFSASGPTLAFGNLPVNPAGDTTSTVGDAFSAFVAAQEAVSALNLEGEVRHFSDWTEQGEDFWDILTTAGSNLADCDDSIVYIQPSYARQLELVHLLGFQYLGAVVGCTGNNPSYPSYLPGGYDPYTAEGSALRVGIPSLLVTLSRYNPQVATTTSIFASLYPCRAYNYQNSNYASDERNNWHGLWELIDADTSNTSGFGADYVDARASDVLTAVLDLSEATTSTDFPNWTNYEQVLTEVPNSVCFSSDGCGQGAACVGYICYSGDPHGENVADVVHHMAVRAGDGWQQLLYGWTLTSSPCLGAADDTYPYNGGFRAY